MINLKEIQAITQQARTNLSKVDLTEYITTIDSEIKSAALKGETRCMTSSICPYLPKNYIMTQALLCLERVLIHYNMKGFNAEIRYPWLTIEWRLE